KIFSQYATMAAIVRGLGLAGVPNERIVVFERYKDHLDPVGYADKLPPGIRFASATDVYGEEQTAISGYDPAEYVEFARVHPGDDPNDPTKRRSYLCNFASKGVTKIINVPALKDHGSAGLTFALKNITYGFVNNVIRSHLAPDNWTRDFLPAV